MNNGILFNSFRAASRAVMLLGAALVVAVITIFYMVQKHEQDKERLVLIPPYLDRQVEVGWADASADYLKSFGMYFVMLSANVTPRNIEFVSQNLSMFVDAKIFAKVRKILKNTAEDPVFSTGGNAAFFTIEDIVFEPETMKVFVIGIANKIGDRSNKHSIPMVYELTTEIRSGRPWITGIDTYEGRVAHTLKWHEGNPNYANERESK